MGMFGGGSSSSKSSSVTTTTNQDKRLVVGENAVGLSIDGSKNSVTVESLDADIAKAALDFASSSDAMMGEGFGKMLASSAGMFNQMGDRISDAYSKAQNDSKGSLEQKTVVMLALIGAGAMAVLFWKR